MDLFLDQKTNDLSLVDGDLVVSRNRADECVQRLYVRFKTFFSEWFYNEDYGVDYLNSVFGINVDKNIVDLLFRNEINKEYLVSEILSFSSSYEDYTYKCIFKVKVIEEDSVVSAYFLINENQLLLVDNNNNKIYTIM